MKQDSSSDLPRILYVEDDPHSAALVHRILEAEGYDVLVAEDGIRALDVARQTQPSLILMDINISGLDGYEVTTRLRSIEDLQEVPIVAVTAATLKGDRERALIAGCNGYIPKPINVDRFPQQVRAYMSGRQEEVESVEDRSEHLVEYSRRLVERLEEKIRELQTAHSELQHIEKMKSDFVILAGHELRTPLTVMYAYSQLLLDNPDIPGSINDVTSPRHLIHQLAEGTRRLNELIESILNVSLIDADRLELARAPVFLQPLVDSVTESIIATAPDRDLTFEIKGLDELPPAMGDGEQLRRALWNVISNAVKYTPDGGRITIRGRQIEDSIQLSVRDTGIGIAPEEQERIFERFYVLEDTTLHRSSKTAFKGGGLGLGLTVARGIIEGHGGKIWAQSSGRDEEEMPGSVFHILLPLPESRDSDE
jgi:signal transduction histidine kinase